MTTPELAAKLAAVGQTSVLRFAQELDEPRQARLFGQLSALDLDGLSNLVNKYVTGAYAPPIPNRFDPIAPMPRVPQTPQQQELYEKARTRGQQLLREGKIGAFLVAGGQGTRLGYDGPKGEYPITPSCNKPLFQVFAEQLLAHGRLWGKCIPWYIMTSSVNDAATRAFFKHHNYFGHHADNIFIFPQGMMPAFAMDGQLLLANKDSLALSPGGNGDCFRSLWRSGAVADMRRRGIVHLSYFNVDNPIVHCIDDLFLGLHDIAASDMSSKAIPKAGPAERVGNFAIADGKLQVIEYSDMPTDLASETNGDGSLKYASASIGIHAIRVDFVQRLNDGGDLRLPWHRAVKAVPCLDAAGQPSAPAKCNAVKLEQFVFDAIPLASNPLVYMTDRAEEFSPVKNAEGSDSPFTCQRDQIRRSARWLEACGISVPRDENGDIQATIEISPLFAVTQSHLLSRKSEIPAITRDAHIYLE